jgi:hypothetical protein
MCVLSNGRLLITSETEDGELLSVVDQGKLPKSLTGAPNWGPIFDFEMFDLYDEKQDCFVGCCSGGMVIIRSGIAVNRLASTAADYPGYCNSPPFFFFFSELVLVAKSDWLVGVEESR